MNETRNLTVMIIEPSTSMRLSLNNMLGQCGITQIDYMPKASTAIGKLQKKCPDIILCEYNLSEGQDGQQLLEDLRHHKLLPLTSMFFMITGERGQGKVISAVELGPTEYLLKPFTAETLLERLGRALNKRAAFMPVYHFLEHDALSEAIEACERGETTAPRYALDFRFMRAELHLRLGQAVQAESIYTQLAETKAAEWARLGMAKALFMQNRLGQAEEILTGLLEVNGKLWEAYDCLADVLEASGRTEEAKKVLMDAVKLSPHAVRRLRKLGQLATETGDTDTALESFQQVVGKIRHSSFRDPEDYVRLVQLLLGKGNVHQASSIVRDLGKSLSDFKRTEACGAISSALIHEYNREAESALEQLNIAVAACGSAGLSNDIKMMLAQSCLNNGMEEAASTVMLDVMKNASNDTARAKAAAVLENAGRKDLGENLTQESRQQVSALLAACEEKIGNGDYQGAVEDMAQAAEKMPSNPEVVLNAAFTLLRCIEHTGWEDNLGAQAHWHIENARRLDPANPRLETISDLYRSTLKKYNIPLERMGGKSRLR